MRIVSKGPGNLLGVDSIDVSQVAVINAGLSEAIILVPASGEMYEYIDLQMVVAPVIGSTLGTHSFNLRDALFSPILLGDATFNTQIEYDTYAWLQANFSQTPANVDSQRFAMETLWGDEASPLTIFYGNATDANQDQPRTYTLRFKRWKT